MIKGTTKTGFKFEIDEKTMDNMELVDAIAELEDNDNDPMNFSRLVKRLLGNDGRRRLYDHVREEDGRVPMNKIGDEIADILMKMSEDEEGKNS